jgi:hypothetical protein
MKEISFWKIWLGGLLGAVLMLIDSLLCLATLGLVSALIRKYGNAKMVWGMKNEV